MNPLAPRRAFTLLEVIVALGILAVGLMVLVDTQATAVTMTTDMDRTTTATNLANEKMVEALMVLEQEGWTDQDVEEEGDFNEFGNEEFRGESLHVEMGDQLADFHWAYTVRKIEMTLPGDIWGMATDLADNGYWSEDKTENMDVSGAPDLSAFGITPDIIADYLSDYIREVRVRVWWGDDPESEDAVELVHHVVNISGKVTSADDSGDSGSSSGSGSGGSSSGSGSSKGSSRGGSQGGSRGGSQGGSSGSPRGGSSGSPRGGSSSGGPMGGQQPGGIGGGP